MVGPNVNPNIYLLSIFLGFPKRDQPKHFLGTLPSFSAGFGYAILSGDNSCLINESLGCR